MADPEMTDEENRAFVRRVHDRGLAFDLATLNRRKVLGLAGGMGALVLTGGTLLAITPAAAAADSTCLAEVESETDGPYPADGTNGVDVRGTSGIVRTDIRSSFGSASDTATGVPLTFSFQLQDLECSPLSGYAVYVWHCDANGDYSMYSTSIADQNYLRGIAATDDTGAVTFTSIFPACYSGRWPHIHSEVYKSVDDATGSSPTIIKTSQMALPEDACDAVYATSAYSASVTNLSQVTIATDNVFGDDDAARELATVTGSVDAGYTATLTVTIDPDSTEATGSGSPSGSGAPPSGSGAPPSGSMPSGSGAPPSGSLPSGSGAPPSGSTGPTTTSTSTSTTTSTTSTTTPTTTSTSTSTTSPTPTTTSTTTPTHTPKPKPTPTPRHQQPQPGPHAPTPPRGRRLPRSWWPW